jgi:hypothetical protein
MDHRSRHCVLKIVDDLFRVRLPNFKSHTEVRQFSSHAKINMANKAKNIDLCMGIKAAEK